MKSKLSHFFHVTEFTLDNKPFYFHPSWNVANKWLQQVTFMRFNLDAIKYVKFQKKLIRKDSDKDAYRLMSSIKLKHDDENYYSIWTTFK